MHTPFLRVVIVKVSTYVGKPRTAELRIDPTGCFVRFYMGTETARGFYTMDSVRRPTGFSCKAQDISALDFVVG